MQAFMSCGSRGPRKQARRLRPASLCGGASRSPRSRGRLPAAACTWAMIPASRTWLPRAGARLSHCSDRAITACGRREDDWYGSLHRKMGGWRESQRTMFCGRSEVCWAGRTARPFHGHAPGEATCPSPCGNSARRKETRGRRLTSTPQASFSPSPCREELFPYLFFAVFLAGFLATFFAVFLATFFAVFFTAFFTATVAPLSSRRMKTDTNHSLRARTCQDFRVRRREILRGLRGPFRGCRRAM